MVKKTKQKDAVGHVYDPAKCIELGHQYTEKKQYSEAESFFKKAIALDPNSPIAINNLGQLYHLQKKYAQALRCYKKALELDKNFNLAKKNQATLFLAKGNYKEFKRILTQILTKQPHDEDLLIQLADGAMNAGQLRDAARFAEKLANIRCGYKQQKKHNFPIPPLLSIQKLQHDIAQFTYLKNQGVKIEGLGLIIKNYTRVLNEISPLDDTGRVELTASQAKLIGNEYNRIIYRPHTPRLRKALSSHWDIATSMEDNITAEEDYLQSDLGITVIDNFLTEKALAALRKFCLESTIWFENRYAYGRLGAFFREGFNCPLLIQIGEEIKAAFPKLIGNEHPLLQIWGFKCDQIQPEMAPHADFAAVNVNFWITPDEANLDENSGGMVIYDVEAPLEWDFDSYNNQGKKITQYLKKKKARAVTIPYKTNRAIIFNSDLFHVTSPVHFKNTYDSKRINITLLYGKREKSRHGESLK